jgi:LDH2 family malate/lactate/ureidoglycolate dehydrogenase
MAAAGCTNPEAELVADVLVEADLRGVFSHGVMRLTSYAEMIKDGRMRPGAEIREVISHGSVVVLDANHSVGPVSAAFGIDRAIELATAGATAFVFVRNGSHFGPAAHWALRATEADCVGFCLSNGGGASGVLAYGSREIALTNGPICWAVPGNEHPALVADMAVGAAAMGKVRVAQAVGESIPADWGLDASGLPTTDPAALAMLNPFAGPKGSGLGFVMETMSGILAGAIPRVNREPSDPESVGQVFAAINIAAFRPVDEFQSDVDDAIERLHAIPPAPGIDKVLAPGEPEWQSRERALTEGLEYPDGLLHRVASTAQRLGVIPFWI